uniref:Uncharacterized protein LOC111116593 n=1 Tax=Crassostrea virginica TaxID=6565 RepID=A0A8B8C6G3_CRAVI|nr:uncharacterized protein LOC111116593 [Crassostrea virginica]
MNIVSTCTGNKEHKVAVPPEVVDRMLTVVALCVLVSSTSSSTDCPSGEPVDPYQGFTSGFLSGAGAMLFLYISVCGTVCLTRKYEEYKQRRRLRKREMTLQIPSV